MFEIVPAIDLMSGRCVRLQQGDYGRQTVYECSPVEAARRWADGGAALIHLVDLDGAKAGKPCNLKTVGAICAAVDCPCELGGGIRTPVDVRQGLEAGASRVILGTSLCEQPDMADELLSTWSADQVVAGLDGREGRVAVRGWLRASARSVDDLARDLVDRGLRHIIYTDISQDGMFTGPNAAATGQLCDVVPEATVVASGGVGGVEHVEQLAALGRDNLFGVIVGKALYDGRVSFDALRRAAADSA